jgi:hypothetical protein
MPSKPVLQWPEHNLLKGPNRSKFDKYYPKAAAAMQEQGMESIAHLADRVYWINKNPDLRDIFGLAGSQMTRTSFGSSIGSLLTVTNYGQRPIYRHLNTYTPLAKVVAFALEHDPEDLFGPPPEQS